jgi:hypothetical protein
MRSLQDTTPDYPVIYKEVFLEEAFQDLPPRRQWDHQINLIPGHAPPQGRCYPLAARKRQVLKDFIRTNLAGEKIQKSDSPYTSPFFFRPKLGTSELQGIQDYRRLNEITDTLCHL